MQNQCSFNAKFSVKTQNSAFNTAEPKRKEKAMIWGIVAGVIIAGILFEFVLICPDKLPWRRRK